MKKFLRDYYSLLFVTCALCAQLGIYHTGYRLPFLDSSNTGLIGFFLCSFINVTRIIDAHRHNLQPKDQAFFKRFMMVVGLWSAYGLALHNWLLCVVNFLYMLAFSTQLVDKHRRFFYHFLLLYAGYAIFIYLAGPQDKGMLWMRILELSVSLLGGYIFWMDFISKVLDPFKRKVACWRTSLTLMLTYVGWFIWGLAERLIIMPWVMLSLVFVIGATYLLDKKYIEKLKEKETA